MSGGVDDPSMTQFNVVSMNARRSRDFDTASFGRGLPSKQTRMGRRKTKILNDETYQLLRAFSFCGPIRSSINCRIRKSGRHHQATS